MAVKLDPRKVRLIGAVLTNLCIVLIGNNLQASERPLTSEHQVTISIESGITGEIGSALRKAKKMFADIGVTVNFCQEGKCPANQQGMIQIHPDRKVPEKRFPGALAFAKHYEGVHIHVFVDRVQKLSSSKGLRDLLGYVFVHEITHILQGISRHSTSGIMKARWNQDDYQRMKWNILAFTEKDITLIHLGLEARASRMENIGVMAQK